MRHGVALADAGQDDKAIKAFYAAIELKPDFVDAYYELGSACHRAGRWEASIQVFEALLQLAPAHVPARLALGAVLIDAKRPVDAERALRRGLSEPAPPRLKAALHANMGLALRRQRRDQEALTNYDQAKQLDPAIRDLAVHRAEALQNLNRHDEALAEYRRALSQDVQNPQLHHFYNSLLFRLRRTDEFLKSYDQAPENRILQRAKAQFLRLDNRNSEACAVYQQLLRSDPTDIACQRGAADALIAMGHLEEAAKTLDNALLHDGKNTSLINLAAEIAILRRDPAEALTLCRQALSAAPFDQMSLALTGVCLRLMRDEREEDLNGFDSLIGVFDLAPPQGYSSMENFNTELTAYLARLHPTTREPIDQSLQGGTQTPDHLFGAGHALVDKLESRIRSAVADYIGAMKESTDHPFLSRRSRQYQYAGSWSSRLQDCGYHKNHLHPDGWISSCYYVQVPESSNDPETRQGWIKFGEPNFDAGLPNPIRRAVQPVAGRLVLFPSYMWHGTIPFHGDARTTLAFDVIPV